MKVKVKLTKLSIVWTTINYNLGYPQKNTLNSKGVKHQASLLHKLTYNTTMTTHKEEKTLVALANYICKTITHMRNKCKCRLLKVKLTKRQNELLHGQPRSSRHTAKPVENEDAERWNGCGGNINRVRREKLSNL